MKIKTLISELESWAPISYQESYDNSGLLVGNKDQELTKALITLDVTDEVMDEALAKGANLVIAHHPIIFGGVKKLTGGNLIERCIIKAIKNDIAIYAIHTNLDSIETGVNKKFADLLGLQNTHILKPKKGILKKLTTYVPIENSDALSNALFASGAGNIGEYSNCSFKLEGTGSFKPSDQANPHIGSKNQQEYVNEHRLEFLIHGKDEKQILRSLFKHHPYEEVSYFLTTLENEHQNVGSGMYGELEEAMEVDAFLSHLKTSLKLETFKYTKPHQKSIKKVALCGGSGRFLLTDAMKKNADIFITSDFKYHEFFDADSKIIIADIGHYESEVHTKDLICEFLSEIFPNIALVFSETNTNPISYYK